MPFKSLSQQRFMFSQHPEIAKRWVEEYGKGYIKNLPDKKKKRSAKREALDRLLKKK